MGVPTTYKDQKRVNLLVPAPHHDLVVFSHELDIRRPVRGKVIMVDLLRTDENIEINS